MYTCFDCKEVERMEDLTLVTITRATTANVWVCKKCLENIRKERSRINIRTKSSSSAKRKPC
jgi:hypothetical protein